MIPSIALVYMFKKRNTQYWDFSRHLTAPVKCTKTADSNEIPQKRQNLEKCNWVIVDFLTVSRHARLQLGGTMPNKHPKHQKPQLSIKIVSWRRIRPQTAPKRRKMTISPLQEGQKSILAVLTAHGLLSDPCYAIMPVPAAICAGKGLWWGHENRETWPKIAIYPQMAALVGRVTALL